MTDTDIIQGLKRNDNTTTTYLYRTLAPPLFKHVLNNSGNRDDAKDVFQETFIKVLNNVRNDKYTDSNKFEAYFLTIAKNTWIDHLRKRVPSVKNVGNDDFLMDSLLSKADESEDDLAQLLVHDHRIEVLMLVWQSWDDTECQTRLKAFHFDNQSTQDIAHTEGVERNTVLKRLYDCRKKLYRIVNRLLV